MKPYQILIEDQQFDADDSTKPIGSRVQYTTSYGVNEQDALDKYNVNFPTTPNRLRTEVVGVDPSFQEMMRTNTSSPNTPYFSGSQYYGRPNPYGAPMLPNTQNIDVDRARETITPFTQQMSQFSSPGMIFSDMQNFAPPPSFATQANARAAGIDLPTTYDAQTPPSFPQGLDPFRTVRGPDGYQGQMDPGSFAPADPNILQGMPLTSMQGTAQTTTSPFIGQNVDSLRTQLASALNATIGFGGFVNLGNNKLNALADVGITQDMIQSNDINVLESIRQTLINTNVLQNPVFGGQTGAFSQIPFMQPLNMGFGNDERRMLDAQQGLREFEQPQPPATTEQPEQEQDTFASVAGQITPADFNSAMQAIRTVQGGGSASLPESIVRLGMSDSTGNSAAAQLVRQFGDAQARSMPFEQAQRQREEAVEQARLNIDQQTANNALDVAGLEQKSANYRAQLGFASDQMQVQSNERINNANNRSAEFIAQATNQSRERVAEVSANASRDVAQINGLSAQQVALINTRSAAEVAEITGMNQREVERIKGDIQERIAQATNTSKEDIARLQTNAQISVADVQKFSAENVARINKASAVEIAGLSNLTDVEVAQAQRDAQIEIARQNRLSQENIAELIYSDDAEALRMEEFNNLKEIEEIRNQYATELAQLTNTDAQRVAEINADSAEAMQEAQLEFETLKYERELEEAGAIQAAERERLEMQFLGGYNTPEEFTAALNERSRGGLTVEEDRSLQALLAAGGLTPEERLAEISAESRSQEMNSLIALLSNPQALGAFVTIVSGELPFQSVPTMGQLAEMTPGRLEYLQGALSALGIDPQTFVRMAQDVTPQAFQETGPFGQLSAMVS